MNTKDVSLVIPSRNNLKYLKWCYTAIRKNIGGDIHICLADDASTDNTWDWMKEVATGDKNVKIIRNEGPERVGHTILYDRIVNEIVTTPLAVIAHADMYWTPGAIERMIELMAEKTIVSATRIEPPLHPSGPEKITFNGGLEPEIFDEKGVLDISAKLQKEHFRQTTDGVFAPWMFWVNDFKEIGGHDKLFAPQSKEDSDIWNRFLLNGTKFIQARDAFVYHLTCRGSRFNPTLTVPGKNSNEWEVQNHRSTRNFIRKWGSFVAHTDLLHPIVPHKYDVGIVIRSSDRVKIYEMLGLCELFASVTYVENSLMGAELVKQYVDKYQATTLFSLDERVKTLDKFREHDILLTLYIDSIRESDLRQFFYILPEIIETLEPNGVYELPEQFKDSTISVREKTPIENNLIKNV